MLPWGFSSFWVLCVSVRTGLISLKVLSQPCKCNEQGICSALSCTCRRRCLKLIPVPNDAAHQNGAPVAKLHPYASPLRPPTSLTDRLLEAKWWLPHRHPEGSGKNCIVGQHQAAYARFRCCTVRRGQLSPQALMSQFVHSIPEASDVRLPTDLRCLSRWPTGWLSSTNHRLRLLATMPVLVFTTPAYCQGGLEFAIARKAPPNPHQYMLVFSRAYGMAASSKVAILNCSTTARAIDAPKLSPAGRPLIWLDSDMDRSPWNIGPPGGDMLTALLEANPPVIRATGRTRMMIAQPGGAKNAHEVELLLEEDQLSRMCRYCGGTELAEADRFMRCGGDDARPEYMCFTVRTLLRATKVEV